MAWVGQRRTYGVAVLGDKKAPLLMIVHQGNRGFDPLAICLFQIVSNWCKCRSDVFSGRLERIQEKTTCLA